MENLLPLPVLVLALPIKTSQSYDKESREGGHCKPGKTLSAVCYVKVLQLCCVYVVDEYFDKILRAAINDLFVDQPIDSFVYIISENSENSSQNFSEAFSRISRSFSECFALFSWKWCSTHHVT